MRVVCKYFLWLALAFSLLPDAGKAQDRVALVIGIGKYEKLRSLENPALDARTFAALLRRHGFTVIEEIDKPFAELSDALVRFGGLAKRASEAIVYLAGHGFERGSANVFAARDADIDCASEDMTRAIPLKEFYARVGSVPKVVMVLDACRDNPFPFCPRRPRSLARSGFGFGDLQGDALQPGSRDQEILVANSTARGELAEDGEPGKHSPYARSLIRHLSGNANLVFRVAHSAAAREVQRETSFRQRPSFTVVGDEPEICLAGKKCVNVLEAAPTVPERAAAEALARTEAERREREQAARIEAERREREQAARAEAERRGREQAARADAERREREQAQASEIAEKTLIRDVQAELQRVRCYPDDPDGKWGPLARQAARKFADLVKLDVATDRPSETLLLELRKRGGRVCPLQCAEDEIAVGEACRSKPKPVVATPPKPSQPANDPPARTGGASKPSGGSTCSGWMFTGQTCTDSRGRTCTQIGSQRHCQ